MAITVTHKFVSLIPDAGDPTIVQPSNWNDTHELTGLGTMAEQNANAVAITGGTISGVTIPASNLTGTVDVPHGGTGATTLTGYVKGSGTSALTASSTIPNTDITGLGTASTKDAGAALGVATLDAAGKVPISQIPDSVIGALSYQGTWNATTNTPTLTSSVGTKGYYYVVSVAGTTDLNGVTDWQVGDWAVYNGTAWQKVDNTDGVTSVNGFTGAVTLTTTNISEGTNLYYTDARARGALSAGTGISYNSTTGVITNSSPSLGGDVVGPASATDNAIARFDTTTGKLIQNSVVTISDAGQIAGATSILNTNYVDFDTTYATTLTEGQLGWNGNNTLGLGMAGGNVVQHIGEDTFFYVKASSAITKGQLCMFTGAVGSSGVLTAAPSNSIPYAEAIMGIAAENIALNGFGLIQNTGSIRGLDTSAYTDGQVLYYDSAVTGGMTATYPASGPIVIVAAVAKAASGGAGVLTARVSFQTRVVASTGISVTQTTDSATITNTGVTSAVAGTGISVSGSTGAVTVTNTAPDQTVSLTGGTGISTSGTYPNFTITNTAPDQTVAITGAGGAVVTGTYPNFTITTPSGTVTSVTGTAPIASSGGATPAISISQATTSTDGYLSSTDWNTFNNKQPAGTYVTSVAATAPITSTGGTTPTLAMPAATGSVNGYLTSTDWTTFNGKAPAVTYTTNYVPFGQGTTTPNISSSFTYVTGTGTLTAPAVSASNGLVINSNTVAASYSIPSGSSASSVGPMTVASGQTVTVPSGSRWVVL